MRALLVGLPDVIVQGVGDCPKAENMATGRVDPCFSDF